MRLDRLKGIGAALSCALLAGCFGGGGGGGGTGTGYGANVQEAVQLRRQLDTLPRLDPADLPRSGSASYQGVAGFNLGMGQPWERSLNGTLDMTVTFAGAGGVSGRVHDIHSNGNIRTREGQGPVAGQLTLRNGALDRNPPDPRFNPSFRADLTGNLTEPAGQNVPRSTVVNGRIEGAFFGNNQQMASGSISGTAGPAGGASDRIAGTFVAARR